VVSAFFMITAPKRPSACAAHAVPAARRSARQPPPCASLACPWSTRPIRWEPIAASLSKTTHESPGPSRSRPSLALAEHSGRGTDASGSLVREDLDPLRRARVETARIHPPAPRAILREKGPHREILGHQAAALFGRRFPQGTALPPLDASPENGKGVFLPPHRPMEAGFSPRPANRIMPGRPHRGAAICAMIHAAMRLGTAGRSGPPPRRMERSLGKSKTAPLGLTALASLAAPGRSSRFRESGGALWQSQAAAQQFRRALKSRS